MQEFQPGQTISPHAASPQQGSQPAQGASLPPQSPQAQPAPAVQPQAQPQAPTPSPLPSPSPQPQPPALAQVAPNPVILPAPAQVPDTSSMQPQPPQAAPPSPAQTGVVVSSQPPEPQIQAPNPQAQVPQSGATVGEVDGEAAFDWSVGEQSVAGVAGKNGLYFLGALLLAAVVYLLTKDTVSTIAIALAVVAFLYFANHKISSQSYRVRGDTVLIDRKSYQLHDFKSYSVSDADSPASIVLTPMKRFMPPITLFVPENILEPLEAHLADYLPFEQHQTDAIDALLHKLRF